MRCDEYDDDLIDAAAGAPASSRLQAHLGDCPACRHRLALDGALLETFDHALRERLRAKPSAAVRERITNHVAHPEVAATWSLRRVSALAAGLAAVIVAGWVMKRPSPVPTPTSMAAVAPVPSATRNASEKPEASAPEASTAPVTVRRAVPSVPRLVRELPAGPREPAVLVPPGQEEALRRFVVSLRNDPGRTRPLLTTAASVEGPMPPPPLLEIPPLDAAPLSVPVDVMERSSS